MSHLFYFCHSRWWFSSLCFYIFSIVLEWYDGYPIYGLHVFIQFRGFIYLESVSRKLPLITSHTLILLNFCLPSCSGEKLETLILGICDVFCVSHSSIAQLCPTLCNSVDCRMQASLSFTNSGALLKLMSIKLVMLSNHLILCCPLLLLSVFFFLRSFFFFF